MTRLAIVVLFTSLVGPAMAAGGATPVPAQGTPVAAKATSAGKASPGKVIADILSVSGMKRTLEKMPANFIAGFHAGMEQAQSKGGQRLPSDMAQAMENSAREAFRGDGFTVRVTRAMTKDYNERNYQELLTDLSTPLARRMAELESRSHPSEQEVSDFSAQLESNPLSEERTALLHRLDVASRSSELMSTAMLSLSKGMMRGMAGANGKCVTEAQLKNAEAGMEEKINAGRENLSGMAIKIMAYTYRDVSDADLAEYLKIYEKENSRHIYDVIYTAVVEEYTQASTRMGRGIMQAVRQKKAAMGSQNCEGSVLTADNGDQAQPVEPEIPPGAEGPADAESGAGPAGSASAVQPAAPASTEQQGTPVTPKSSIPLEKRKGGDITKCLEAGSKSDKDIAACAEKFRR